MAATQVYPLLILLIICIIALQSLGYVNLARFLLTSVLLTGLILAVAHLAGKGMDKLLHWWLVREGRTEGDFLFGREATETLYTVLSHAAGYVAYLIAVVMIAGTWGVDLSGVYATLTSPTAQEYYRRLSGAILVIIISIVILRTAYYVIDKVFNIPSEEARSWRKKIALGDKGKTIAPLLKNLLKYCIIFVAAVVVLRVLGVDPTPIIAGAGVVGSGRWLWRTDAGEGCHFRVLPALRRTDRRRGCDQLRQFSWRGGRGRAACDKISDLYRRVVGDSQW